MTNPPIPPPAVQEAIATHAKRDPWRKGNWTSHPRDNMASRQFIVDLRSLLRQLGVEATPSDLHRWLVAGGCRSDAASELVSYLQGLERPFY